jgi:CMP-N,N'-diacetyllegionaminic acid synthase
MPKVFAIIPARSGSKGVPDKNIKLLAGHSLMEWSVKTCLKSELIDQVYVSTDSQTYAEKAISYGAKTPFLRPKEISGDKSTDFEFMLQAINWFKQHGCAPEYIVHIRPTTPLRNPKLIDDAIKLFTSKKCYTALRSVHEMSESAYKSFEISEDKTLKKLGTNNTSLDSANCARQDFPKTYIANGYVDVLSVSFITENNLLHGDRVIPFITPEVVEVDTWYDFEHLEFQLSKNPNLYNQLWVNK